MSARNRFPFTANQWQELEHQALIFKYMVSGMPIPPDLLFTLKRSYVDSSFSSSLFSHQSPQHIGWNCFQVGLGKKIDPEPGRCRRTDGKKWRCSKEAYPDSKYCERHMHRGKNRSRKPVEILSSQPPPTPTPISSSSSSSSSSISTKNQSFSSDHHHHCYTSTHLPQHQQQPFLYSHRSSSRPPQDNNTNLFLYSGSYSQSQSNSDYRRNSYGSSYGLKDEVDEHAFFSSEPSSGAATARSFSGSSMEDSWQLTPLTMSSSSSTKQRSCSGLQTDYSYLQLQPQDQHSKEANKQDQHCYLLGSDIRDNQQQPTQKIVHRFFEEWPPKNRDSWLDLDDKSSNSATRLSISIPTSSLDFPIFNSRTHNDG